MYKGQLEPQNKNDRKPIFHWVTNLKLSEQETGKNVSAPLGIHAEIVHSPVMCDQALT